mmetsp:Transcript_31947/g.63354  ORF Transcript_31947/g.63354 Transcript_31947/m.63354 type:complete len:394 (+) Transcript_31947:155-1336(+)
MAVMDEDLVATLKTLQSGQRALQKRQEKLDSVNTELTRQLKISRGENESLRERIRNLEERDPEPPALLGLSNQPVKRWDWRWRCLMLFGGLLGPGMAAASIMCKSKDALAAEKMAWASGCFGAFSITCLLAAALGDVQSGTRVEKVYVFLCGIAPGAAYILQGVALDGIHDSGSNLVGIGIALVLVVPWAAIQVCSKWNGLEDRELGDSIIELFKSMPYTLGSMMFLSSSPLGCILDANDDSPVYEQCGNPIAPSQQINSILFVSWVMLYWVGPIKKDIVNKSWEDVMTMQMSDAEGLQLTIFGLLSIVTNLQAANLSEDGDSMSGFMENVDLIFQCLFYGLVGIILLDVVYKSWLFHCIPSCAKIWQKKQRIAPTDSKRFGPDSMGPPLNHG